jgi:hypothetical protein
LTGRSPQEVIKEVVDDICFSVLVQHDLDTMLQQANELFVTVSVGMGMEKHCVCVTLT